MSETLFKPLFTLKRFRLLIVYSLIFILSGFVGNVWMTRHQQTGPAPLIVAEDLDGKNYRLDFNQQDKPVVLYFFAEWCPICKVQHSVISSISQQYEVLGIAMQSGDMANVRKYVQDQGIKFRVINDEYGNISRSFGVNGVPAAFILNNSGEIKYSTRGYATEAGLLSRIWLAEKSD